MAFAHLGCPYPQSPKLYKPSVTLSKVGLPTDKQSLWACTVHTQGASEPQPPRQLCYLCSCVLRVILLWREPWTRWLIKKNIWLRLAYSFRRKRWWPSGKPTTSPTLNVMSSWQPLLLSTSMCLLKCTHLLFFGGQYAEDLAHELSSKLSQ